MATYPDLSIRSRSSAIASQAVSAVNVEAWTEQATAALNTVQISGPAIQGTSAHLTVPLEGQHATAPVNAPVRDENDQQTYQPRREPMRRDSLKRREALLKGKEGSRRRQRWENDRLLNNPWAQPPLPSDWEVRPTYPRRAVPYFLAPLWDTEMAARNAAARTKKISRNKGVQDETVGRVPKELRDTLKRAKAAKGLLHDLEEEVRKFVKSWEKKQERLHNDGLDDIDSEEEEIVFVGRSGQMHDMPPSPRAKRSMDEEAVGKEKLVFDSLANDHRAGFGRWLVHSIATYYGLRTWSITVGDPARREAYVGIKQMKIGGMPVAPNGELPRPLWGMV